MSTIAPAYNKANHIDTILNQFCKSLQLSRENFVAAREKYEKAGAWLIHEESPVRIYSPRVFHQGSMLIDTTIRPLKHVEYDLDVVCLLKPLTAISPRQMIDLVWKRLRDNVEYRDIIQCKQRCIRLNFPNKFHLDIVPAIASSLKGLLIPDFPGEVGKWKHSDPEGFANWFEVQCLKIKEEGKRASFSMSEANVEPIPDRQPYHSKRVLKRVVQLIKRWRDVKFHGREELSTPSIVITRLAADFYDGDTSVTAAVMHVVDKMHAMFAQSRPVICNPINENEIISEKWDNKPESFDAFKLEIADFREKWRNLPQIVGAHNVTKALTELFGDLTVDAVKESFAPIEEARTAKKLYVSNNTLTLTATPTAIKVKSQTFYGE